MTAPEQERLEALAGTGRQRGQSTVRNLLATREIEMHERRRERPEDSVGDRHIQRCEVQVREPAAALGHGDEVVGGARFSSQAETGAEVETLEVWTAPGESDEADAGHAVAAADV